MFSNFSPVKKYGFLIRSFVSKLVWKQFHMIRIITEIIVLEHNGDFYDFTHSLASAIPPGVIANVASDSGLSGLEYRKEKCRLYI